MKKRHFSAALLFCFLLAAASCFHLNSHWQERRIKKAAKAASAANLKAGSALTKGQKHSSSTKKRRKKTRQAAALSLTEHWERKQALFSDMGLFVSINKPEIIASINKTPRKNRPLPDSAEFFKKLEPIREKVLGGAKKNEGLYTIESMSGWKPSARSWNKDTGTFHTKGGFYRKKEKVFFQEFHFYSSSQVVQVLLESSRPFSKKESRVLALLSYAKNKF